MLYFSLVQSLVLPGGRKGRGHTSAHNRYKRAGSAGAEQSATKTEWTRLSSTASPHIRKLIYTPHISMVCCRCKKGLCSGCVCAQGGNSNPVQIVAAQDAQTRLVSLHVIIVNTQCCVWCACSAGPTRVVINQNYTLILWCMVYSGL